MPRVSVVITALNADSMIAETLDSILAQEFRDLEAIVVDGGSTDRTIDVVSRYAAPVRLLAGQRLTKSAGRNVGIRSASGEYIALVDADDSWLPGKLARQLEHFERSPSLEWVYSDCFVVDGRSRHVASTWSARNHLYSGHILERLLFDCFVPSPTPVIRRKVFDEVGFYDESFLRHEPEDWDMWMRIAARYPVGVVQEPLARLRVHPSSLTAREDLWLTAEGALAVVRRAFERNPGLSEELRVRVVSHWHRCLGSGLLRAGRTREARELLSHAIEQGPLDPGSYIMWASTWLGDSVLRSLNRTVVNRVVRLKRSIPGLSSRGR